MHRFVEVAILREIAAAAEDQDNGGSILPSSINLNGIEPIYVAWMLVYLDTLRTVGWPDLPPDDNHSDSQTPITPWEMSILYVAEVTWRVQQCGRDGRFCLDYYQGQEPDAIAFAYHLPMQGRLGRQYATSRVCLGINRALFWCAGRRKQTQYAEWYRRDAKSSVKSQACIGITNDVDLSQA
jgi:hypothetical protein